MPRFSTVSTVDGSSVFQLQPQDFVEIYNGEIFNRATRTEIRKAIKAIDKFLKDNPNPLPTEYSFWHSEGQFSSLGEVNTGYGDERSGVETYLLRYNTHGGFTIGCMQFDKKALNKVRTWAATSAKRTATTKRSSKKAATKVAA